MCLFCSLSKYIPRSSNIFHICCCYRSGVSCFKFHCHITRLEGLMHSSSMALQPLWVLACQLSLSILSRKVFTECRCQWHVKPPTWRTSDLERSTLRHKVSPTSETTQANPSSGRWKLWARNCGEFCRKWRLPRHFWVLLHAVNLRHGTDGFTSPPKEGVLRISSPEKSDGFGWV